MTVEEHQWLVDNYFKHIHGGCCEIGRCLPRNDTDKIRGTSHNYISPDHSLCSGRLVFTFHTSKNGIHPDYIPASFPFGFDSENKERDKKDTIYLETQEDFVLKTTDFEFAEFVIIKNFRRHGII